MGSTDVFKDLHAKEILSVKISSSTLFATGTISGAALQISSSLLNVGAGIARSDNLRISGGNLTVFDSGASPATITNAQIIFVSGGRLYTKGTTTETLLGIA